MAEGTGLNAMDDAVTKLLQTTTKNNRKPDDFQQTLDALASKLTTIDGKLDQLLLFAEKFVARNALSSISSTMTTTTYGDSRTSVEVRERAERAAVERANITYYDGVDINTYHEFPDSFISHFPRDPRANHLAAKVGLKEDIEAADNFHSLQLFDNSKDAASIPKSILKKRQTHDQPKSLKRVHFDPQIDYAIDPTPYDEHITSAFNGHVAFFSIQPPSQPQDPSKGRWEDARQLFDEMPVKAVASWQAMIFGFAPIGRFNKALGALELGDWVRSWITLFAQILYRNIAIWNAMKFYSDEELYKDMREGMKVRTTVLAELVFHERVVAFFAGEGAAKETSAMHALLWNSGAEIFRSKDYQISAELFEKSMSYVPYDIESRILSAKGDRVLCLCHLGLSQIDRAKEYIDEAEKLEPNVACAFFKFKIYLQQNEHTNVVTHMQAMASCLDFMPDFLSLAAHEGRVAFQPVHKGTKKDNHFEKDFIFIPVNFSLHWSLIIICHLGEVINFNDKEVEKSSKLPCILHMDSIRGSHRGLRKLFQSYLWKEWKNRHDEAEEDVFRRFLNLQFIPLELPQQQNSFDCGLFLLHYVEFFLANARVDFNPLNLPQSSSFLRRDWFPPAKAFEKRACIRKLIIEIFEDDFHEEHMAASDGKYYLHDVSKGNICIDFTRETCGAREGYSCADTKLNPNEDVQITSRVDTPLKVLQCSGDKYTFDVVEFGGDTWDYNHRCWLRKLSSLCTYECWKCQRPGHIAENCLAMTSNCRSCSFDESCKQVAVVKVAQIIYPEISLNCTEEASPNLNLEDKVLSKGEVML